MLLKLEREEETGEEKRKEKIKRLKKKHYRESIKKKWKPKRDISATGKMSSSEIVNIVKTSFSMAHLCLD